MATAHVQAFGLKAIACLPLVDILNVRPPSAQFGWHPYGVLFMQDFLKDKFFLIAFPIITLITTIYAFWTFYPKPAFDVTDLPETTMNEYIKMADQGDALALDIVASSYISGVELPQDFKKARMYATELQSHNPSDAARLLETISLLESANTSSENVFNYPSLEVLSYSCHQEGSRHVITEGLVKNTTNQPLKGVQAVISHFTADNRFITSDSSYLEFQPVMPNQISPFKIYSHFNPEMDNCTLSFKSAKGDRLLFSKNK